MIIHVNAEALTTYTGLVIPRRNNTSPAVVTTKDETKHMLIQIKITGRNLLFSNEEDFC